VEAPVLGQAVVLVKTSAKMVVAMIMAMPMGKATRPHTFVLLLRHHHHLG